MDMYLIEEIEARLWANQASGKWKDTPIEEIKLFNEKIGDGKDLSPENQLWFLNYMREKLDIPVNTLMECWINKCRELL